MIGKTVHVQLIHDPLPMGIHSFDAHMKTFGEFFGGFPSATNFLGTITM